MMMANLRSARHGIHAIQRLYGMQGSVARNGTWRPRLQSSVARAVPKLHFDRFPLDRAGEKRQDPVSVNALIESPDSIVVVFVDGRAGRGAARVGRDPFVLLHGGERCAGRRG
jgi:hypothetical protein